jgi:hypothetical protein
MKFEELMKIVNDEVSKVIKEPLKEPVIKKENNIKKKNVYKTALQSESEIDEILFIQDDIKKLEKEEKNKPKNL